VVTLWSRRTDSSNMYIIILALFARRTSPPRELGHAVRSSGPLAQVIYYNVKTLSNCNTALCVIEMQIYTQTHVT
jgi:hypothetical protein